MTEVLPFNNTYGYLMSGEVEFKRVTHLSQTLTEIRDVARIYTSKFGSFHFSTVRVVKDGKFVGYGIGHWISAGSGNDFILETEAKVRKMLLWEKPRSEK